MSSVSIEELLALLETEEVLPQQAIGYHIQIGVAQQRVIVRQGGYTIRLMRAEAELRQRVEKLEQEQWQTLQALEAIQRLLDKK